MITEKEKCTGCFACVNKCPKQCIEMKEDSNGYISPEIDEEKCIHCDLCKKICPSNNKVKFSKPKKCYAVYSKNEKIRKSSTSGGFATICSKLIINEGGTVYGAAFIGKENLLVKHIRVDNEKDLHLLQGSKYVHSYIEDTLKLVKNDLEQNIKVLFIGTPCQIAGLKKFLDKEYENLYTIDLVCHGVPPQKYLEEEIKKLTNQKVDNVIFRTEEGYVIKLYKEGKLITERRINDSAYCYGFLHSLISRENCYECIYAKPERCSDITIGDFWGIDENAKLRDTQNKGLSVVLPITKKGQELFEMCKEKLEIEERPVQEAINGNTQLRVPSRKPPKYEKIKETYIKKGYKKTSKMILRNVKIKSKLKNNKIIYGIYKKIK